MYVSKSTCSVCDQSLTHAPVRSNKGPTPTPSNHATWYPTYWHFVLSTSTVPLVSYTSNNKSFSWLYFCIAHPTSCRTFLYYASLICISDSGLLVHLSELTASFLNGGGEIEYFMAYEEWGRWLPDQFIGAACGLRGGLLFMDDAAIPIPRKNNPLLQTGVFA